MTYAKSSIAFAVCIIFLLSLAAGTASAMIDFSKLLNELAGISPLTGMGSGNINCGDGIQSNDELCDDGNTDSGDGCSATCEPECSVVCDDDTDDTEYGLTGCVSFLKETPPYREIKVPSSDMICCCNPKTEWGEECSSEQNCESEMYCAEDKFYSNSICCNEWEVAEYGACKIMHNEWGCTSNSDCTSGTTCVHDENDEGVCCKEGEKASNKKCVVAQSSDSSNIQQTSSGTSSDSCSSYTTEAGCSDAPGCHWVDYTWFWEPDDRCEAIEKSSKDTGSSNTKQTSSGTSSGYSVLCSGYTTETECNAQSACHWVDYTWFWEPDDRCEPKAGSPGNTSLYSDDYCTNKIAAGKGKCKHGEGDCDGEGTDEECEAGLICFDAPGLNILGYEGADLCCKPGEAVRENSNGKTECYKPEANETRDCNPDSPCKHGQGDCGSDADCQGDLVCAGGSWLNNINPFASGDDLCCKPNEKVSDGKCVKKTLLEHGQSDCDAGILDFGDDCDPTATNDGKHLVCTDDPDSFEEYCCWEGEIVYKDPSNGKITCGSGLGYNEGDCDAGWTDYSGYDCRKTGTKDGKSVQLECIDGIGDFDLCCTPGETVVVNAANNKPRCSGAKTPAKITEQKKADLSIDKRVKIDELKGLSAEEKAKCRKYCGDSIYDGPVKVFPGAEKVHGENSMDKCNECKTKLNGKKCFDCGDPCSMIGVEQRDGLCDGPEYLCNLLQNTNLINVADSFVPFYVKKYSVDECLVKRGTKEFNYLDPCSMWGNDNCDKYCDDTPDNCKKAKPYKCAKKGHPKYGQTITPVYDAKYSIPNCREVQGGNPDYKSNEAWKKLNENKGNLLSYLADVIEGIDAIDKNSNEHKIYEALESHTEAFQEILRITNID